MGEVKERNIISDKLVIAKTKKSMEDWFKILDKKGAKKNNHLQIFNLITSIEGLKSLGQWNHNLLATTYEWNRGLKERGQKENGIEISISKTIAVSTKELYKSFAEEKTRNKWLKEKIIIRKATEYKSARITWSDNQTGLSVDFYEKDKNKSQVVVQHLKIQDSRKAAQLKVFWSKRLEALKNILEFN